MKYLVIIEKAPRSFGAYVPDLPGCVAVAKTRLKVKRLVREAIRLHIEDMRERGYPIPKPTAASEMVELQLVRSPSTEHLFSKRSMAMPLRDHFRPPTSRLGSWEAVHGGWPMTIIQSLAHKLPPRFVAHPKVHLGTFTEIDVSTYERNGEDAEAMNFANGDGGVATAVWAPALPTLTVSTDLASQDEFEVRVYDNEREQRLVAAIELVSPANKDRPAHRRTFVAKCAALLQNHVTVTIVDLVTTRANNLYGDLLELIGVTDPALGANPPGIYAVTCRAIERDTKRGAVWQLDAWYQPLQIGAALPTLPLWLADDLAIPLELEASYEETCNVLRIA